MKSIGRALKAATDFAVASGGLLAVSPFLAVAGIAVFLKMGFPVLFRQERIGWRGEVFTLFKFRTMTLQRNSKGKLLSDQRRLMRLGRFLRKTSLDELPQLWNVLKGDMSLVGPRPLLPEYLPRYDEFQRRRHEVKPGMTGWAQINGRNALTWEQKFELDVWYVDNWSLWLDVKILWMTLIKVIRREGVNAIGSATMPEYMGMPTGDAGETEKSGAKRS